MKAAPDVSRIKAAPDVSRMKAAPDVSRMTAAPVLLVLLLLCVCEVGVGGAQESPPSLSDVMKEVKVLRGMVVDLRGDNAVMAARCACQKQLDTLQSNMSSRLSAGEAKMGEVIEAKMGEVIEKLQKHKDCEKDNLTDSYNRLQTKFDQLQTTCNPITASPEDGKRLCESGGFTYDGGVCYYISTEAKTWDESRRFCRGRQADLIIINSQEKEDLLDRVVPGGWVWIGLTDRDTEGSYKWVDGTPMTSPFWYPGYPTGTVDHDCVGYWNAGGQSRGWYDYPCSDPAGMICERVVQ